MGSGQFFPAGDESGVAGSGPITTYRVEVERDLPWNPDEVATVIDATLGDRRGWIQTGSSFRRTPSAPLRILLATPGTVDKLCAPLKTRGEVSCRNGDLVVLNAKRWKLGIKAYRDLDDYRRYLINHEVGHALGYSHRPCPSPGKPAPVMQQQSISMQSCRTNPWPTPTEISQTH